MSIKIKKATKGFSLLEVMLVILIMTMVAMFALRMQGPKLRQTLVDHAAGQMRQIMEAATAYYIGNGQWPMEKGKIPSPGQEYGDLSKDSISVLTSPSQAPSGKYNAPYLPSSVLNSQGEFISPFAQPYYIGPDPNQIYNGPGDSATYFEVQVDTQDPTTATQLQGKLPLAYITPGKGGKNTVVTAYLNIPSYDYNHANTVSDVGVYHPGDCIAAPTYACPSGMHAATFVTLEQGYGFTYDPSSSDPNRDTTVSPVTGFSASINPGPGTPGGSAALCNNIISGSESGSTTDPSSGIASDNCNLPTDNRVCVYINTTSAFNNGQIEFDSNRLADTYVLAMTKCVPTNS